MERPNEALKVIRIGHGLFEREHTQWMYPKCYEIIYAYTVVVVNIEQKEKIHYYRYEISCCPYIF